MAEPILTKKQAIEIVKELRNHPEIGLNVMIISIHIVRVGLLQIS
jgi:hypothetical protein